MKHRCYNCKCLEEESTYQAHKRKKHDLNAKFYCKKCRKNPDRFIPKPVKKESKKPKPLLEEYHDLLEKKMSMGIEKMKEEDRARLMTFVRMFRPEIKENLEEMICVQKRK